MNMRNLRDEEEQLKVIFHSSQQHCLQPSSVRCLYEYVIIYVMSLAEKHANAQGGKQLVFQKGFASSF